MRRTGAAPARPAALLITASGRQDRWEPRDRRDRDLRDRLPGAGA
ncbi:hypothetical protein [Streptosporangium sp. NPDC023615]